MKTNKEKQGKEKRERTNTSLLRKMGRIKCESNLGNRGERQLTQNKFDHLKRGLEKEGASKQITKRYSHQKEMDTTSASHAEKKSHKIPQLNFKHHKSQMIKNNRNHYVEYIKHHEIRKQGQKALLKSKRK